MLVTPDVFRLTLCIKNLRFWRLSNSLTEKQSSETCSTRKTDSRDVSFVISETPDETFRDITTDGWREQNVLIVQDSTTMLVKCTLKGPFAGVLAIIPRSVFAYVTREC